MNHSIHLTIITQGQQLLDAQVDQLTAPAASGEITVLPGHIPLFSRLQTGELRYKIGKEELAYVISKGFIDVGAGNQVTVLVDSAVAERDISVEKAQAAIAAAHETLAKTQDQHEMMMAEASLRLALLEIRVAQKTKRTSGL